MSLMFFSGCLARAKPISSDNLRIQEIIVGDRRVNVELAKTPKEQFVGLRNRQTLAPESGMLFLFEAPVEVTFTMKDTYLPLSIAFTDTQGVIFQIMEMVPLSGPLYSPKQPVFMALEMNKGWFAKHHIGLGSKIFVPQP